MGLHRESDEKCEVAMTLAQCIIAALIVFGWGVAGVVAYCIAKDNRKKTDRIARINKKDDLLAEVEKLSLMSLEHFYKSEEQKAFNFRVGWKIEDLRKIYGKLECGDVAAAKIRKLRKLATLDIENAAEYDDVQYVAKEKAIREVIAELESIPEKRF